MYISHYRLTFSQVALCYDNLSKEASMPNPSSPPPSPLLHVFEENSYKVFQCSSSKCQSFRRNFSR